MKKQPIQVTENKCKGRPIAVLGGGPALESDLEQVPEGAFLVGCNHHSFRCTTPNVYVFVAHPERSPLGPIVKKYPWIPRLSLNEKWTSFTYDKRHRPWFNGFSGSIALWWACYMGGGPVLLAGFDCYQGGMIYPGAPKAPKGRVAEWFHKGADYHRELWRPALTVVAGAEKVRAISGPLVDVFGAAY